MLQHIDMRRRKPFKNFDANRGDRKQEIAPNDPPDETKKETYSPTASIVAKTRHLVNDEAFNFLSSSLELKVARKHEERQKKARIEIAKARERSMKDKSNLLDKKTTEKVSRLGNQTKTPKISNCTGNKNNLADAKSSNPGGPKSNYDGVLQGASVEAGNVKTRPKMVVKKPKLPTIEEEDPMLLSDLIGADQRDAFRTIQLLSMDSRRLDEQSIRGSDIDNETKDQSGENPGGDMLIDSNKNGVVKLLDHRKMANTHGSEIITSFRENIDTEIPDLSTRLEKDLEIRDEYHEDMELVATDDESLKSSSASSREESCGVDEKPNTSSEVPYVPQDSASKAVSSANASTNYQSPVMPVAPSPSQRFLGSGFLSRDVAKSLTKRFRSSPIMPNSTSFSKTPVSLKSAAPQHLFPIDNGEPGRHNVETPRNAHGFVIACDPTHKKDASDEERRVREQTSHSMKCSPDMTVDEILRALIATPPENAAAVGAMLASCKNDGSISGDLLNTGFVVEIDRAATEGSCGEASELTCDFDGGNAHQKRKKKQNILEARKRIKIANSSIIEQAGRKQPAYSSPPGAKDPDLMTATQDSILQEASPEKTPAITAIPSYSKAKNSNPSMEKIPLTAEMIRKLGVTPPTNPYLGFEVSNEKIPTFDATKDINSPYLWTAQRAGHFIIEPIFQLVDGNFYRHPPLPPGWTISVSQSRSMPFYHHPDFGSTWYPPVALPMAEGNVAGRRMLVSTHANEHMIPWSGFVNQFGKNNSHLDSSCDTYTPESQVSHFGEREDRSSSILQSVLYRETPLLPTVSRNVAFSDHTGCSAMENTCFHVREEQLLVPSSNSLRPSGSLCSTQQNDEITIAEKKPLSEFNQKHPSLASCRADPSNLNTDLEVDSRRGDGVEQIEMFSKFAIKGLEGKVVLLQSSPLSLSTAISATSRSTSQSPVSRVSCVLASTSKKRVRGILDTPGRSTATDGESRGPVGCLFFADDFRGVGFESDEIHREQTSLPGMGLEDLRCGDVNLGEKHVCMSHEKHSDCGTAECSDIASVGSKMSTRYGVGIMGRENDLLARQSGFESPNSHQSCENDFPAPDDDQCSPAPDDDQGLTLYEELQAKDSEELVRDRRSIDPRESDESGMNCCSGDGAENEDPPGLSRTEEDFDSPDDEKIDHYLKASKVSSVFVPRVKLSVLHETNQQLSRGADDSSVDSWRSRASSLMSSSSRRVRFPPMPICSLQALETCPIVKTKMSRSDHSRKTTKAKKLSNKSMRQHVYKATR